MSYLFCLVKLGYVGCLSILIGQQKDGSGFSDHVNFNTDLDDPIEIRLFFYTLRFWEHGYVYDRHIWTACRLVFASWQNIEFFAVSAFPFSLPNVSAPQCLSRFKRFPELHVMSRTLNA